MRRALSVAAVALTAMIALLASWTRGPLAALPGIVRVDEHYFEILLRQYLFVGLVTSIWTVVAAEVLRVRPKTATLALLICGAMFPAITQLSDGQFDQSIGSTFEFLVPYSIMGAVVFALWLGAKALVNRLRSVRPPS